MFQTLRQHACHHLHVIRRKYSIKKVQNSIKQTCRWVPVPSNIVKYQWLSASLNINGRSVSTIDTNQTTRTNESNKSTVSSRLLALGIISSGAIFFGTSNSASCAKQTNKKRKNKSTKKPTPTTTPPIKKRRRRGMAALLAESRDASQRRVHSIRDTAREAPKKGSGNKTYGEGGIHSAYVRDEYTSNGRTGGFGKEQIQTYCLGTRDELVEEKKTVDEIKNKIENRKKRLEAEKKINELENYLNGGKEEGNDTSSSSTR